MHGLGRNLNKKQLFAGTKKCPICGKWSDQSKATVELAINGESGAFSLNSSVKCITDLVLDARPTAALILSVLERELSAQEKVVLLSFLRFPSIKQVARKLGKQEQTIRNQLNAIRGKIDADSLCDLLCKVFLAKMAFEPTTCSKDV